MRKTEENRVVLTGGHAATTALAIVQEVREQKLNWELHWIGGKSAFAGLNKQTFESKILPDYSVSVHQITAGKIIKQFGAAAIASFLRIPVGFLQAYRIIVKLKPKLVLSFGGYTAVPVVITAWILGVPVIVQEQIRGVGWGNRLSAIFAKKVIVSFAESKNFINPNKVLYLGSPLTQEILCLKPKTEKKATPNLLIVGGSRGSQAINETVFPILSDILKKYRVNHITGELNYQIAQKQKKLLPSGLAKNYNIHSTVSPAQMGKLYDKSDMLVGRAGANTVAEVLYLKLPAIFIPIPWSLNDEQAKNADFAKDVGIAVVLHQNAMTPKILSTYLEKVDANWKKMNSKAKNYKSMSTSAGRNTVELLKNYL